LTCKGICSRYKAVGLAGSRGRYRNGQKRCMPCEVFMDFDGLFCPCCGMKLRSKPRNKAYKAKYHAAKGLAA